MDFAEILRDSFLHLPRHTEPYRHFSYVYNGRSELVSVGRNQEGASPIYARGKVHAEYMAVRKALRRVGTHGYEIANVRIGRDMRVRLSRPCARCLGYLRATGCTHVWYTINESEWGRINL